MTKIKIKPLSVNQAWQGKRYKTKEYKAYERIMLVMLPRKLDIPKGVDLSAEYEFGVSSKLADWDNPIKPVQDILQKKYGFDDRQIVSAKVTKTLVKKGEEFIRFELREA